MNVTAEMINRGRRRIFPTEPFYRKDTRELVNAVRHGDINKVRLLVKFSNRFLVFDYDDCL